MFSLPYKRGCPHLSIKQGHWKGGVMKKQLCCKYQKQAVYIISTACFLRKYSLFVTYYLGIRKAPGNSPSAGHTYIP